MTTIPGPKIQRVVLFAAAIALLVASWSGASADPTDPSDQVLPEAPDVGSGQVEREIGQEAPRVRRGQQVSIFRPIHIAADEIVRGEIVCIGCDAVIEGEVTGDIVIVGGSLRLSGKARHDVVCVISNVELSGTAEIGHDFVNVFGKFEDLGVSIGNGRVNVEPFLVLPGLHGVFGFLAAILIWLKVVRILITFFVLLLIALLVPERVSRISEQAPVSYGLAVLTGLGGYFLLWLTSALLTITIIGIPFAIVLQPVFLALKVLGLAGIFHLVGQKVGRRFGHEMSVLGAILFVFLPVSALLLLPYFLGFPGLVLAVAFRFGFWALVELPAVGLILLTRAGGRTPGEGRAGPIVVTPEVVEPSS